MREKKMQSKIIKKFFKAPSSRPQVGLRPGGPLWDWNPSVLKRIWDWNPKKKTACLIDVCYTIKQGVLAVANLPGKPSLVHEFTVQAPWLSDRNAMR